MVVLMRQLRLGYLPSLGAIVTALVAQSPGLGLAQTGPVETVEIRVERFSFTPSQIRIAAGTTVELRIRSEDTNHGFRVIGSDIDIVVPKRGRGTATVRFRAERPGEYVFECSKLCGAGHSFMRGTIVVTEGGR